MNSLSRLVGFSVLLLLVFVVAALTAQGWLHRQTQAVRAEVVENRRAQFAAALTLSPKNPAEWDESFRRNLGALLNGTVALFPEVSLPPTATGADSALLSVDEKVGDAAHPLIARLTFAPPPLSRLLTAHQRVVVGLLLLGGLLAVVGAFLVVLNHRSNTQEPVSRSPWRRTQAEMGSLEQLAKTSVAQRQALDDERVGRRRAEEDAQLKEGLLARSIEERIGLGRDLHDGIIQSLYAVGLTLEAVRGLVKTEPDEVDARLAQCLEALNKTIREVRSYILGLAPEHLRRSSFTQALGGLLNDLGLGQEIHFDVKVDDEACALLSAEQVTESLQIAREAVSNAIRHGGASAITLRVHKGDGQVCLLVQDNGTGFDASRRREGGHGLGNMEARARRVGATTTISSRPGEGTRILVNLPVLQSMPL